MGSTKHLLTSDKTFRNLSNDKKVERLIQFAARNMDANVLVQAGRDGKLIHRVVNNRELKDSQSDQKAVRLEEGFFNMMGLPVINEMDLESEFLTEIIAKWNAPQPEEHSEEERTVNVSESENSKQKTDVFDPVKPVDYGFFGYLIALIGLILSNIASVGSWLWTGSVPQSKVELNSQ